MAHATCIKYVNRQLSVGGATFVSRCWWIENKAQRSGGCVCPSNCIKKSLLSLVHSASAECH